MPVLHGPDDVLRTPGGVATHEDAFPRGHEGGPIDHGHVPLAELDPDVALDPREGVVLSDRQDHVVGLDEGLARLRADQTPFLVLVPLDEVEHHPFQSPSSTTKEAGRG